MLIYEIFKVLKLGFFVYVDDVEKSVQGIWELLDVVKQDILFDFWKVIFLVFKVIVGLCLLFGEKVQKLLQKVKEVFKVLFFFVGDDCVFIMNGIDEGVLVWIIINFLIGSLKILGGSSVGMLDLGGGFIQIVFLLCVEGILQVFLFGYLMVLWMFNRIYKFYFYSYFGFGLMLVCLVILGGVEGQFVKDGKELVSFCLFFSFKGEWEYVEVMYRVLGQKVVVSLYELCVVRVLEVF